MRIGVRVRALLGLATLLCLGLAGDNSTPMHGSGMAFASAMPRTVVWAWEEPEDLRALDPTRVGVAYLAETLLLDGAPSGGVAVLPRRQPLAVPEGAALMAVVRIETRPGFQDSPQLQERTAANLLAIARRPGTRALQIDFDAKRSERPFYVAVLGSLRRQMPQGMPVSITALTSWCAAAPGRSWLAALPIDEAVPMFFRLGGDALPYADKTWLPVREPKCQGSVGIATDESWPHLDASKRVYLFAPAPWRPAQLDELAGISDRARPAPLREPSRYTAAQALSASRLPLPVDQLDEPNRREEGR